MRLLRFLGFMVLLAAIAVGAADALTHGHDGGPMFRSAFDWWMSASPTSLAAFREFIVINIGPTFWDPPATTVLAWPAALVLGLTSMAIFLIVGFLRSF